jgi:hypothetical protein
MDPTEDKEEVIKTHDEYLRLSEAGMSAQERLQIKSFKDIIDYERCITVLNYDNWNTLNDKEKQEYASKTESRGDLKHQNRMTRKEVELHSNYGKQLAQKWDSEKEDKDKEEDSESGGTTLMTQFNSESGPLACVGIDTCSAKSISCLQEDFLDLQISPGEDVSYELREVGGISKAAGKGVMVLYAKDMAGKTKAIIEPKGIYLDHAPSQFRILGQQKMKKRGVSLIQDYDDAGGDILKCKRSGTVRATFGRRWRHSAS